MYLRDGIGLSGNPLSSKGLAVGLVDFRPSLSAPWQRVVYTAGTAESFTGYDNLWPDHSTTRIYDTEAAEWAHAVGEPVGDRSPRDEVDSD